MRDAPAVEVAQALTAAGARVRAYDPVAMEVAAPLLPAVEMCDDPYTLSTGCDALMVITEWNEFKQLDLEKIKGLLNSPIIFDGRNIYDPWMMNKMGFQYRGMGRGINGR
jgi:UDPglucose 6-dehydrogenase